MVNKKTWEEFKESGLLWFINTILHTFGWAICFEYNKDKGITEIYPARVKFRGFSEELNTKGYKNISKYMKDNANKLFEESNE